MVNQRPHIVLSSGLVVESKDHSLYMLKQQARLHHHKDISSVRRQGKSWRHALVILLAKPNRVKKSRFAFIANRKVGNAVIRNRAKRLLREVVRYDYHLIKPGWDCLFIARPSIRKASFVEVQTVVRSLLVQANLLVGEYQ